MLRFDDIVFGPIVSRRLGSSLGVNVLPTTGKLCNFDCVYCECGWNKDGKGDNVFPCYHEVAQALQEKMAKLAQEGTPVDSITFSGNGEPTMNPDFARIVEVTLQLRDRYYPNAKVSVLSNATLAWREDVFQALSKVDNAILKLDAGTGQMVEAINKPVGAYNIDKVVESLKRFEGRFVLQTMFLRSGDFDTTVPEVLGRWMDIVREISPREIMIYTIDRETPDKTLRKYSVEEMRSFVQPLLDEGYDIQIRG